MAHLAVTVHASEPGACPDRDQEPTAADVAVTTVPIAVSSTSDDYFVLYVRSDPGIDSASDIPVLVARGEDGTTTLAENITALPADHYRVEKYQIDDPADVDGDCVDDITELDSTTVSMNPVNPASVDSTAGAVMVPDREALNTLGFLDYGVAYLKFIMTGLNDDRPGVYFMNSTAHPHHQTFLDSLGLRRTQSIIGLLVLDPAFVASGGRTGVYYYRYERPTSYSFAVASRIHTVLAANMPVIDSDVVVHLQNSDLRYVQSELSLFKASRLSPVFDEDILTQTFYRALNPGEAYGRLRRLQPDDRPHPRDIVIYGTLPNELPRVSGILSTVPQTPLSHVNLRAVQNGIPNAFVGNSLLGREVSDLLGGFVRYTVSANGWDLESATKAEVDAAYAASRPPAPQLLERDLSVTEIAPLSDVGFDDWTAFGVKAANVAVLGKLGFPAGTVPDGFAVPFYFCLTICAMRSRTRSPRTGSLMR